MIHSEMRKEEMSKVCTLYTLSGEDHPRCLSMSLVFIIFWIFPSVSQNNWKKDPVNPLHTGAVNPSSDIWPSWWDWLWFGTQSPCSYGDEYGTIIQVFFNLMVGTHCSFNQNSVSIVSAMELETSVRKLRTKRSLGRDLDYLVWLAERSGAERSWAEPPAHSIPASVLCTVRVPHHNGKGHGQLGFSDWGPVPPPHVNSFGSLGIGATCGWEKAAIQSWHVCTAQMEPCCLYESERR